MSPIDEVFFRCRAESRAALVAYLPAGYPDQARSEEAMRAVVEAGADIVEVGVPYSDPLMDGPVIQAAAEQALAGGFRFADTFACVRAVADSGGVPVVMSYWNPVLHHGVETFARDLAAAGGAGLITPDLIPDEAAEWTAAAQHHDIAPIFLVAPSSTEARIVLTTAATRGFVYAASTMGVTGARTSVADTAGRLVARVRAATDLPVCVGLGISSGEQAAQIAAYADGVIVGSALVRALTEDPSLERLRQLTAELADGVRAA